MAVLQSQELLLGSALLFLINSCSSFSVHNNFFRASSLADLLRSKLSHRCLDPLSMTLNSNSIRVERRDVSGARQLTRMDDKEGAEGLQIDSDIYEVPKRVTFVEQKILSQILWEGR